MSTSMIPRNFSHKYSLCGRGGGMGWYTVVRVSSFDSGIFLEQHSQLEVVTAAAAE